jgi:anti-sigma regulatory factor (Ser/Thr protein kinase)
MTSLRLDLTAFPANVAAVRAEVAAWADDLDDVVRADLILAVDELVSNAIKHGPDGARVRLVADRLPDGVRVAVRDEGLPQVVASPDAVDEHGRGLRIVEAVTEEWGVTMEPMTVWFMLRRRGR